MCVGLGVGGVMEGGGQGAARRRAHETTAEGRKRGNLGRFVLRGKTQPVGVLTKQLSRQGRGRGNFGRLVFRGKAQPVGVHTKILSRQGRGQGNLGRLRRRRRLGRLPSSQRRSRFACRGP